MTFFLLGKMDAEFSEKLKIVFGLMFVGIMVVWRDPQQIIGRYFEKVTQSNNVIDIWFVFITFDIRYFPLRCANCFSQLGLIDVVVFTQILDFFTKT